MVFDIHSNHSCFWHPNICLCAEKQRVGRYLEAVKLVADAKEVKHLVIVPSETEYGDKLPEILEKVDGKDSIHVLGMNPLAPSKAFRWEMMGYAVLQALGIRSDEI